MRIRLMLLIVVAVVLSATSSSFAAIYKYIDENGIVSFADDLQSVPEKSRATAKIVGGEKEPEKAPVMQKQPQAQAEAKPGNAEPSAGREKAAPIAGHAKSFFNSRVLISVLVVVSVLFAFVILGILDADHKKSIKIVRVVLLWGMSLYLIVAHGGDVVNLFRTLKGNVDTVQRESEEKGKKASKALKELNGMIQNVDHEVSQDPGGAEPEKKD